MILQKIIYNYQIFASTCKSILFMSTRISSILFIDQNFIQLSVIHISKTKYLRTWIYSWLCT